MPVLLLVLALLGCRPAAPAPVAARPEPADFGPPPDARVWYLRAVAAEADGDLVEAKRSLEWVTRLDRKSPWPWVARGRLAELAGELSAAIGAYEKAISMHPLPEAHLGRGRVWLKQDQPERARPDLEVAADAALDEATALLVRLLIDSGQSAEAHARLVPWRPAAPLDRATRAELLAPIDPAAATDAWLLVVDVRDPALEDVAALVDAAVAGCRAADARRWLDRRAVATWGRPWAELVAEVGADAPGCATDAP